MAELKIYGKITALSEPEKINVKKNYRQFIELSAIGKGAQNVYEIVNYGDKDNMLIPMYEGKRVETECWLNSRKFDRGGAKPRYGIQLVLKSVEMHG